MTETAAKELSEFSALATEYGPALQRLVRGYEADPALQQDLLQEILVSIWRALPAFEARSSLRTFLYRVAHNVAVTHVIKRRRDRLSRSISLDDEADHVALARDALAQVEARDQLQKLAALIRTLRPQDAQIVLLYFEGLEHGEIAEVTGLTATNVGVKVHRIKSLLQGALS